MTEQTATIPTVRTLRRRWKPHKERLLTQGGELSVLNSMSAKQVIEILVAAIKK